MQRIKSRMVAIMLIITLTFTYISIVGMLFNEVYAEVSDLESQSTKTDIANVEFNAYFSNNAHTGEADINSTNMLYLNLNVKNSGYLKSAKISFENANFIIADVETNEKISGVDKENNQITLNQINGNENITLQISIQAIKPDKMSQDMLEKEVKAKLEATYMTDEGEEKNFTKEITNKVVWVGTSNIVEETNVVRFIPYHVGEKYGVMVQTSIKTGLENSNLPISKTSLEVQIPEMNNEKATEVKVYANSTEATNGDKTGIRFNQDNWTYDEEKGKVLITVENKRDESGQISWSKNCMDEYIITSIYEGEEAYNYAEQEFERTIEAKLTITPYNDKQEEISKEVSNVIALSEKIGEFIDVNAKENANISKGYMYANYDAQDKIETTFEDNYNLNLAYINPIDTIMMEETNQDYITNEGNRLPANSIYTRKVLINQEEFNKYLGQDGTIEILSNGTTVATINKDSQKDDSGNIYVDLSEMQLNTITIKVNKPISEGILNIKLEKAIKSEFGYTKQQLENISSIEMNKKITALNGETVLLEQEVIGKVGLEETVSKAQIELSTTNLSTVVKNEGVEFKVILNKNDLHNALYKNPVIEIQLPEHIESLDIRSVSLLFEEELKIKDAKYSNELKRIRIELEGTQTKYDIGTVTNGAVISMTADIVVGELTPSSEAVVKMHYTNENKNVYENTNNGIGYAEAKINFVAPTGLVTVNSISTQQGDVTTSIGDQTNIGKIDSYTESKNATVEGRIINNLGNAASGISILGRIPYTGNKEIETGEDLGTTFDTTLIQGINVSGIDAQIYYSENGEATKDLQDAQNGWVQNPEDISKMKSYLIVLNNSLEAGAIVGFSYGIQIPANLRNNNTAYATYKVYYNNEAKVRTFAETSLESKVGLSTPQGPELEVEMLADVENNSNVKEGQLIKYTARVKNVGTSDARNVTIKTTIPDSATYVKFVDGGEFNKDRYDEQPNTKEITFTIETVKSGETREVEYFVKPKALADLEAAGVENKIVSKVTMTADLLDTEITSNEYVNTIETGYLFLNTIRENDDTDIIKKGAILRYNTTVENVNSTEKTNVVVTNKLPEGVSCSDFSMTIDGVKTLDNIEEDSETRTVTYDIGTLDANEKVEVFIELFVSDASEGEITNVVTATCDQTTETISSNPITVRFGEESVQASVKPSVENEIYEFEELEYIVDIENAGTVIASNITIEQTLPTEFIYDHTTIIKDGQETSSRNKNTQVSLKPGESVRVIITVYVDGLVEGNSKDVEAKIEVFNSGESISSNTIKHTILRSNYSSGGGSGDNDDDVDIDEPIIDGTFRISGTAWEDSNRDGRKDASEGKIPNMTVILVNAETNQIVTDANGNAKRTTTDENGRYTFVNVTEGRYIVLFLYDTNAYVLTDFQKSGVDESENSDVTATEITLNGETTNVAVTQILEISNSNIYNIDIGLARGQRFDLKLDKTISKITYQNQKETKEIDFNDSKFAKIEISNRYVNGTNVIIEYKIKVTNEGEVAGYARKIVDYLPDELTFNSELNTNWYLGNDGNVYCQALENEIINPGETKEVTLVLTKRMTENNLGLVNNNAEIYEAYNDYGIADIDSTPNNNASEDDKSSADALLSISTGVVINYIATILGVVAIIGVAVYIINKKFISKI